MDGLRSGSDHCLGNNCMRWSRLYVNFFQPSFKLKSKIREGAKVKKTYYLPETRTSGFSQ